jgi:hypothetical protein
MMGLYAACTVIFLWQTGWAERVMSVFRRPVVVVVPIVLAPGVAEETPVEEKAGGEEEEVEEKEGGELEAPVVEEEARTFVSEFKRMGVVSWEIVRSLIPS